MSKPRAAVLQATVEHEGTRYSMSLVRTHFANEGDVIMHQLSLENTADGEPATTEWQDFGNWYIKHADDAPSVLRVECNQPEDCDDFSSVMNLLLAGVDHEDWGAECFEVWP